MKDRHLSERSVDELWALHAEITSLLSSKMTEEKDRLDQILRRLELQDTSSSGKRSYPPVLPKFRNPVQPSETWAGRGKPPRWLSAALKKGKRLEDFKISA